MTTEHILEGLKDVARQLGIQIRIERGSFRGGICNVSGDDVIVLNRHHVPEVQIVVLAESLREADVDRVYMRPALRKALEEMWARAERIPDQVEEGDV